DPDHGPDPADERVEDGDHAHDRFGGPTQIGNTDLGDGQSSCTVMAPDGQSSSASRTAAARSLGGAVSSTSTRPSSSPWSNTSGATITHCPAPIHTFLSASI